ncbi:hypothetical protein HAX54_050781 [Datura stramonium]|uniref:Uncharacterized protein n=1 Tax=Datura stramonium TaxID=4076 RepID=A0ABS8SX79_DATST|nr:hypothetical protein [Datura stramonium]
MVGGEKVSDAFTIFTIASSVPCLFHKTQNIKHHQALLLFLNIRWLLLRLLFLSAKDTKWEISLGAERDGFSVQGFSQDFSI